MTDIQWPPPVCPPCKGDPLNDIPPRCDLCVRERGCECTDCPWLYEEDA